MKLFQKTGRYYLWFSITAFVFAALVLFLILTLTTRYEIDQDLKDARIELLEQFVKMGGPPTELRLMDEIVIAQRIQTDLEFMAFSDTSFASAGDPEVDQYRMLTYHEKILDVHYRIAILHSQVERKELFFNIGIALLALMVLFFIAINVFNRYLSKKLWSPFYKVLEQIQKFDLEKSDPISLEASDIDEFEALNRHIRSLTAKLIQDYRSVKEFSSNASHEIQTPLAIMQGKIELLQQKANLSAEESTILSDLNTSFRRLSGLTNSLLLLTKIDNDQFSDHSLIDVQKAVKEKLEEIEPMTESKAVMVKRQLHPCQIEMSGQLLNVLITNLLTNSIKHNVEGGEINVLLNTRGIKIRNTGLPPKRPLQELTERFQKGNDVAGSYGLGLSIVFEICKKYGFEFSYSFEDDKHTTSISFAGSESE